MTESAIKAVILTEPSADVGAQQNITITTAEVHAKPTPTKPKKSKMFTLTIVRHGQAYQNTPGYILDETDVKHEGRKMIWDSNLTEKGLMQANLIAERFKDTKFDMAITSDMKRTAQTSKAIMSKNSSIKDFNYWTIARERYMGDFEFDRDRCKKKLDWSKIMLLKYFWVLPK